MVLVIAAIHSTSGRIEIVPVHAHFDFAKDLLRAIVAIDGGVYRAQLVDEDYDRTAWDSYTDETPPAVGTVMFAGVAA